MRMLASVQVRTSTVYPDRQISSRGSSWSTVVYNTTKIIIDVCVAGSLLILAMPVMLVVAAIVKSTSPGPVFFRQRRLRQRTLKQPNREFICYKFRTMARDAERRLQGSPEMRREFEESYKIKDDPRVTRIGRFLRKTSLDELPQLWNVLRGELSLIGPRAIVPAELLKYGENGEKLLSVKPGLSGYWQVHGRSDTSYSQRIQMDMNYIDRRSTALDLKLICLTAYVVTMRQGAY